MRILKNFLNIVKKNIIFLSTPFDQESALFKKIKYCRIQISSETLQLSSN